MYYSGDRIREYKVSTENLTEDQIDKLDTDLQKPLKMFFIIAVVLFFIAFYSILKYLYLPLELSYYEKILDLPYILKIPFFLEFLMVDDAYPIIFLITLIGFLLTFFIMWKAYYFVAHYYISSKVKDLEIKNLEAKIDKLDNKLNTPIPEKPLSPTVQKEINKIRAFAKKK